MVGQLLAVIQNVCPDSHSHEHAPYAAIVNSVVVNHIFRFDSFYRLTNNIDAMHHGCTFLIRKVQDTSTRLTDVRPSTQVA